MEEEVTRRTVAISVQASKLTGRVLAVALKKALEEGKELHQKALTPTGRQSVKKLMNHYGDKSSMQLVGAPRKFDRIAREFKVDYAFYKTGPGHYLLFFKEKQADAITAAFQKYTDKVLNRGKDRLSILGQLRQFGEHIKTRQKEREKAREAVQER